MLDLPQAEQFVASVTEVRLTADVDALMALFHADAVFRIVGVGEVVTGKEAIRAALERLVEDFEFLEWQPIKSFVDNDDIVVRQRLKVRHVGSGKIAETETCEFLTVKDGKCTSYVQFADTALIRDLGHCAG